MRKRTVYKSKKLMELYFPKIFLLVRSYNFPMAAIVSTNAFYYSCLSKFFDLFLHSS